MTTKIETTSDINTFVHRGSALKQAIRDKLNLLGQANIKCIAELTEILNKNENPVESAVMLLVYLEDGVNLSSSALAARGIIERAAFLTKEIRELNCFASNLHADFWYTITPEDAIRFGLY